MTDPARISVIYRLEWQDARTLEWKPLHDRSGALCTFFADEKSAADTVFWALCAGATAARFVAHDKVRKF